MDLFIEKVKTKRDLKEFIRLNHRLYKGNPYAVPNIEMDLLDTFNPKKNPSYQFCETELFLAKRGERVVGRIAGIINHKANRIWHSRNVRFGWIDFEDDREVSKALIEAVIQWGKEKGMTKLVGPLGFTDLDPEGMLVEGFDQLSTAYTIYNYPYYPEHLEALGLSKEIDWVERKVIVQDKAEREKYIRITELVKKRYNLHVRKFQTVAECGKIIHKFFEVINKAYAPLYEYNELSREQIDYYWKKFTTILDPRLVSVVEDKDGNFVAVGVGIPSISYALQKGGGKLFPFGWWHLLKALKWKYSPYIDLLLVAVVPEYQSKGANALLFDYFFPIVEEMGFEFGETQIQLKTNNKSQNQWRYLNCIVHKRRRCYKKDLS